MFWSNDESKAVRGHKSQEAQQTNDNDCNYEKDFVLQLTSGLSVLMEKQ